jgi:2-isopropylmalate synthase
LEGAELDAFYHRFTTLADRKKNIYDQDLVALLADRHAAAPAFVTATDHKAVAQPTA